MAKKKEKILRKLRKLNKRIEKIELRKSFLCSELKRLEK